jgi:DNA polymerase-3 subunit epsilon
VTDRIPERPYRRERAQRWRAAEYVSLDFEATGLDFERDRIISFGAVPIRDGRVELGEASYQLVDPGDRPVSPGSVAVHGIRPVDLVGAASQDTARRGLAEILSRRYMIAWHAGVEIAFLSKLFRAPPRRWSRSTIDVRDLLLVLEGEGAAPLTLTDAAALCGVPVADPHHALDDALVTAQLFLVVVGRLVLRDPLRTVGDLLGARLPPPPVLRRPRAPW